MSVGKGAWSRPSAPAVPWHGESTYRGTPAFLAPPDFMRPADASKVRGDVDAVRRGDGGAEQ